MFLELIKFDVSNTSYYVEVEHGVALRDVVWSWKMIVGGHGKSWKTNGILLGENVGTVRATVYSVCLLMILCVWYWRHPYCSV